MKYTLAFIALLSVPAFAAKVYTYKDANGKTVFSDIPPQGVQHQEKKLGSNVIDTSGWPYEMQQVIRRSPVTLWGSNCGELCDQGRKLLSDRGVPFEVKEPGASKEQLDAFKKLTGGISVPALQIGGQVLTGYGAESWNAALSKAGYPATPLKGIQPTRPVAAKTPVK